MSELKQRKQKKRKEDEVKTPPPKDEPTKEEYNIAKWMRQNVPTKKTKFLSHTVEYFTACKAIDELLESQWAKAPKDGEEALFTTRESVVEYLETMLRHKLFHRARKIVVPESELKSKKKKDKDSKDTEKENKKDQEKDEGKKKDEAAATAAESSQAEGEKVDEKEKKKQKKEEGEKKKRKIRLDMHLQQVFVDSTDAYVWLYEPTPYYYYIFGFLVVVATIGICLFPLWPSSVRQGVYYLSLAAAGFLVFILALAVIRLIVFCIVWGLSFGRHHLWLLPNLTEDVGFLASFWPLFKHEYKGDEDGDGKKKITESESSDKPDNETAASSSKTIESEKSEGNGKNSEHSETESEGSQKSQVEKDFEMVEHEEVDS